MQNYLGEEQLGKGWLLQKIIGTALKYIYSFYQAIQNSSYTKAI